MKTITILSFVFFASLIPLKAICQDKVAEDSILNPKVYSDEIQVISIVASKDKEILDPIIGEVISDVGYWNDSSPQALQFLRYHYDKEDIKAMADWTQILGGKL